MLEFIRTFLPVAPPPAVHSKPQAKRRKSAWQLTPLETAYVIIDALDRAKRPLSVTEMAAAMECSVGEASKRVKACSGLLKVKRVGRYKLVSRRKLSLPNWQREFDKLAGKL